MVRNVHVVGLVHAHVSGGGNGIVTGVVAALAGVVVAGFLNLFVNGRTDRRRTDQRIRAGAQLLSTDLISKSMSLIALETSRVWSPQLTSMLTDFEAWNQARSDIAYEEWEVYGTVAALYVGIDGLRQRAALRPAGTTLTAEDLKLVGSTKNRSVEAIAVLGVFTDPPNPWRHPRQYAKWKKSRVDAKRRARAQREKEAGIASDSDAQASADSDARASTDAEKAQ